MVLDTPAVRQRLKQFDFASLFTQELGWDFPGPALTVQVGGQVYSLRPVADKRGVRVFSCVSADTSPIPDYATRRNIEKQVQKRAFEHLLIFADAAKTMQIWQWVARQPGHPAVYREHSYSPAHQSGDALIQKLEALTVPLSEEEAIDLTGTVRKLKDGFDRDGVTKRFYERFKTEHGAFLSFVTGITDQAKQEWYASLMLNRLMFVYFIQKKNFLDEDRDYLKNRLEAVKQRKGKDKFHTFYRLFLLTLFHEGFAKQPKDRQLDGELRKLLGVVPYLNGGLFDVHELETQYPDIDVPDEAFERLFRFFDQYDWHLDTRLLREDWEINPDVLGYIFEKYINQKEMGAYYTKEDITDYISKNAIVPFLFDAVAKKCPTAFETRSPLWQQLQDQPDRYIYPAVRKGVVDAQGATVPLPSSIQKGVSDVSQRDGWNRTADAAFGLPTETWREHVSRRQRCLDVREKLLSGQVATIYDFITLNLDIRQFAEDTIESCEDPDVLRAFYRAVSNVKVLDPTCGSGAFLFASLGILEPLYEACLDRMQAFINDLPHSSEASSSRKYKDFHAILADAARHPNRAYFILKSIIVHNLYGVDIMDEAIEICKLRLFLKLVAQVERDTSKENLGIEALPDIDFNIRSGNTLVGFATLDEVKRTLKERLGYQKTDVDKIVEEAEIVDRAFNKFHEMQTNFAMDAAAFANSKQDLRDRLNALAHELDRYLADEYGINTTIQTAFDRWQTNHQPFHWFAEFYGIMSTGGFDVIVGNPPYVEYREIQSIYKVKGFSTESCGNLYALSWERCLRISHSTARIGLIVPVAAVCTDSYAPLQKLLAATGTSIVSNFNDRPSKLFDGLEHIRLCIIVHEKSRTTRKSFSTTYNKWQSVERPTLFQRLAFVSTNALNRGGAVAKIGSPEEAILLAKIGRDKKSLSDFISSRGTYKIFYTRKLSHFVQILDFVPMMRDSNGQNREPSELKVLSFETKELRDCFLAILNSSMFYWLLTVFSDCRNLNKRETEGIVFDLARATASTRSRLSELAASLMGDIGRNSEILTMNYKKYGQMQIQCTYPKRSKKIIDQIDVALGEHFGFSPNELDFIINYDIKYRMGQTEGDDL